MRFRLHRAARFATLGLIAALLPAAAWASSHREAPAITKDPLADNTDVYAFVSPDAPNTVTLISNWVPIQEPAGGPNFFLFDDEAVYTINVDNDGDAADDIVYEFRFATQTLNSNTFLYNTGPITSLDDPDFNVRQTYSVTRVENGVPVVVGENLPVPPYSVGPRSTPDYATLADAAVSTLPDGSKVFAGPRDDAFFVDLGGVFDLLGIRKLPGDKGKGQDDLAGFNVLTISLQIPKERLTRDGQTVGAGNSILGIWSATWRPATRTLNADGTASTSGPLVQVSRLGQPLVNEVVIPRSHKDLFNATLPTADAQFLSFVQNSELATLLNLIYGVSVPPAPRNDLVTVFLTGVPGLNQPDGVTPAELLRLNMAIPPSSSPNALGVIAGDLAGFPNGRRLADDVTDIALRVVAGVLVDGFNMPPNNRLGDGIDHNDLPFLPRFPYQALPHSGPGHDHHAVQNGASSRSLRAGGSQSSTVGANASLQLAGPHPGPTAALEFTVPAPAPVSLRIYDARGRLVRTLVDQDAAAGTFRAVWDGFGDDGVRAATGVYFARFAAAGQSAERKIVLQ